MPKSSFASLHVVYGSCTAVMLLCLITVFANKLAPKLKVAVPIKDCNPIILDHFQTESVFHTGQSSAK